MLLYFSATGNCKYAALRLAQAAGEEALSIVDCLRGGGRYAFADSAIGIVVPTYFWGLPSIVREFLGKASFQTEYLYFVATYGTTPGAIGAMAREAIRGRGIDENAMAWLLERHAPEDLQFVDGWTGKGAIQGQLQQAMQAYPGVSPGLAVLSDPACLAEKWGTREDFLIASSCLNSVVSGLLSRTVYRPDLIGPQDFHGAVFYDQWQDRDLTYQFIDRIEAHFRPPKQTPPPPGPQTDRTAAEEVTQICRVFGVRDRNLVKPSIGEATRVLLRRMPWKILVHSLDDEAHLGHLYQLAREKQVPLEVYPLVHYRACGLIREMADA